MSRKESDTGAVSNDPDEEANGPLAPEEAPEEQEASDTDEAAADAPGGESETDSTQEEESQGEESQGEESQREETAGEPNGHLKINITIGEDGRTTVGLKRHDTDLVMTTIFATETDEVLRQVPGLIGRAEARWTLEKMNPAYNRNPNKAKSSKAKSSKPKTQTNQNRSNPVATAATLQTSSGETPPPEAAEAAAAEDPAEPQAEPLRLF